MISTGIKTVMLARFYFRNWPRSGAKPVGPVRRVVAKADTLSPCAAYDQRTHSMRQEVASFGGCCT
jgi:hypothetical protein